MKKVQTIIFAMLAVFALGALMAATASAETTLLASWLWEGAEVSELLSTETKGTLLLEDTETIAGAASVECTATADGSVGPNGEDETTEILNVNGEKVGPPLTGLALLGTGAASGEGSECKEEKLCKTTIEVWPVGLPWHTSLFLMENGEILNLITSEVESEPESGVKGLFVGYELKCLVLGINTEDTCWSADFEIPVVNDANTGDAAIPNGATTTPNATCSQSGLKATGVNQAVGTALITPLIGLLTVSSE